MAPRTSTGTVRKIDSQRNFVGEFLENNIGIYVFKHYKSGGKIVCTLLNAVCTPYKRKYKIVGVKNQTSSNTLTLEDLNCIFFFCSVVSFACFHLTGSREIAYTFHVTDDACKVIYIRRVAVWALFQVALVDVSALVAHRVRYIECEVVAPFFGSHAH